MNPGKEKLWNRGDFSCCQAWLKKSSKILATTVAIMAMFVLLTNATDTPEMAFAFAALPGINISLRKSKSGKDNFQPSIDFANIVSMKWRSQFMMSDKIFLASLLDAGFAKSWEDAMPIWISAKKSLIAKNLQQARVQIKNLYSLFEVDFIQINMAAIHLENNNPAGALRILEFAAKSARNFWEYYFNKALAYFDIGEYREALVCLKKLSPREQENVKISFCFAKIYQHLGHYYKAGEYLELTSRLAPNYSPCWFMLGINQSKLGRLEQAYSSFNRAAKIRPQNFGLWYNKGNVLLRLGKFDKALQCFRHALHLNPGYAMAWNNLGITFTRLGRSNEALQSFRRALSFQPRLSEANLNCGLILDSMGNLQKALEYYRRFLQIASKEFSKQKKSISLRIRQIETTAGQ